MTHARLLPVLLLTASAATVVDHKFADGDSQNQDLENNSLRLFNGRTTTIRTDKAGTVTLDVTPTGTSSEAFGPTHESRFSHRHGPWGQALGVRHVFANRIPEQRRGCPMGSLRF